MASAPAASAAKKDAWLPAGANTRGIGPDGLFSGMMVMDTGHWPDSFHCLLCQNNSQFFIHNQ
jgi:hypothetical protein